MPLFQGIFTHFLPLFQGIYACFCHFSKIFEELVVMVVILPV